MSTIYARHADMLAAHGGSLVGLAVTKDRADITDRATFDMAFTAATADELGAVAKALGKESVPEGYVAGWASTPDVDTYGHVVMPGAFAESIARRGLQGPKGIKFLIGHAWDKVGGAIKVLEYRGGKLWIEAQFNLAISYAKDAYEATKSAGGMSFSVGFFIQDYEFKEDDVTGNETLIIHRGDLFEVSAVPFPANENCGMEFVKSAPGPGAPVAPIGPADSMSDFERSLLKAGLVKNRSDAHRVVEAFKSSAHLFKWGAPKEEPKPTPAPIIDEATLEALSKQIADLKAIVAPAAK